MAEREIAVMRCIQHPHVTRFDESFRHQGRSGEYVCLVMEYCAGGDLFTRFCKAKQDRTRFAEAELMSWVAQACSALQYMHDRDLWHRDIKPANILFDAAGKVKLGDFGLSTTFSAKGHATVVGTPFYFAPEVMLHQQYSNKIDIWNLGVVLLELITFKQQPINVEVLRDHRIGQKIRDDVMSSGYSRQCALLVASMLSKCPSERPSAREVLQQLDTFADGLLAGDAGPSCEERLREALQGLALPGRPAAPSARRRKEGKQHADPAVPTAYTAGSGTLGGSSSNSGRNSSGDVSRGAGGVRPIDAASGRMRASDDTAAALGYTGDAFLSPRLRAERRSHTPPEALARPAFASPRETPPPAMMVSPTGGRQRQASADSASTLCTPLAPVQQQQASARATAAAAQRAVPSPAAAPPPAAVQPPAVQPPAVQPAVVPGSHPLPPPQPPPHAHAQLQLQQLQQLHKPWAAAVPPPGLAGSGHNGTVRQPEQWQRTAQHAVHMHMAGDARRAPLAPHHTPPPPPHQPPHQLQPAAPSGSPFRGEAPRWPGPPARATSPRQAAPAAAAVASSRRRQGSSGLAEGELRELTQRLEQLRAVPQR
eukprot:TRINITY_DN11159_c0_g1_i2.p1 TRINITY_DN11159_c0_g1~~TRINITY_DN11159_c0_g1_i2.p1  ORF type:complete len:667 (+),score=136.59 TRINITY_DN11159_c0_g1_i2:214-2001(+)